MAEQSARSSLLRFIIVALILITLFVGGAYFVQQARHKPVVDPTPVTELPGGDQKPAEESTTPPPTNDVPNHSAAQSTPQPQAANRLPQSGPADSTIAVVMLGLLVGVGISYVQSRRRLAPL